MEACFSDGMKAQIVDMTYNDYQVRLQARAKATPQKPLWTGTTDSGSLLSIVKKSDRHPLYSLLEKPLDSKASQVCQIRVDACGQGNENSTKAFVHPGG
eukprot:178928-Alexandrium_andersonii.AAC.1